VTKPGPSVCFGAESGNGACRLFRAEIPAKALEPFGWQTSVSAYMLTPQTADEIKKDPRIRGWGGPGTEVDEPADIVTLRINDDVVIDPEQPGAVADDYRMDSMAADIRRAREAGQVVLYDIDDDLWNIPLWSPASRAMHKMLPGLRAVDLDVVNDNIAACDGVVTPTKYLADELRHRFPEVEVFVLPPGIDPAPYDAVDFDEPSLGWIGQKIYKPKGDRKLQVGWMGAISHHLQHLRSMQTALDCLPALGAEFTRLGWIPSDRSEILLAEVPCRVHQVPWGGVDRLPAKLAQLDVGIIPRVDEPFHQGQSITSGLQYAAAGVPFIATATGEYVELAQLGVGLTTWQISGWRAALTRLLSDATFREEHAAESRKIALEHYGLEATGRRYNDVLSTLL
jgi:glycosyltransferase involved in cell wall biosynthesis